MPYLTPCVFGIVLSYPLISLGEEKEKKRKKLDETKNNPPRYSPLHYSTMSFGGQFDPDSEIERQFQEEIRRRQAAQQHQQQQQQQQQQYHHLSMLQGADPYNYAAAAAAARHYPGGPYGIPPGTADAYGDKASQVGALAQYYAAEQQRRAAAALQQHQQQQQQQQQQQGYRSQMHDPRWQMAAAAAASQYGAPSPYYARDAYPLERQSSQQHQQQQHQQQQQQQSTAQAKSSPAPKPAPGADTTPKPTPSTSSANAAVIAGATAAALTRGREEEVEGGEGDEEITGENGDEPISNFITYTKAGKPRKQRSPRVKELQELRTIMKKSVLHQHRQVDNEILDENNERKWYTGCVPLGLPDDKYWLSELQVYLRANFAEAFGATEDDIAAPMHGRNKPIALGQVGIRCMHCKST